MTNVSAVEKMAELMQQMEENSPRVAALQYCLTQVAEKVEEAEKRNGELEARCAALAAENAGLKDINSWCKTDAFKNMYREFKTAESLGCHDVDCMHDAMLTALMHAPKTPATDAFLAEVRAQGVEMLTSKLQSLIDEGNFEGDEIGVIAGAVYTGADIAAQIRKGVQS
ncbi:Ead/Ea22-like family protein [Escherichia coli]